MITRGKDLGIFLQTIKPGLNSKHIEVILMSSRLLNRLGTELQQSKYFEKGYEWLVSENGGLIACIDCLKKYPDFIDNISLVLLEFGKFNLYDFCVIQLRKTIKNDNDYVNLLHLVYKNMINENKLKLEVI